MKGIIIVRYGIKKTGLLQLQWSPLMRNRHNSVLPVQFGKIIEYKYTKFAILALLPILYSQYVAVIRFILTM